MSDAPPAARLPTVSDSLPSVEELVRVLDVAGEVRRRQEVLDRLWDRDSARTELRETLMETARLSGETLSEEEVDTAVDWYFDRLHRFTPPPEGLKTTLLRAYAHVVRHKVAAMLFLAAGVAACVWLLSRGEDGAAARAAGVVTPVNLPATDPPGGGGESAVAEGVAP